MFQRASNGTIFSPRHGLESLISSLSTFETSDPRDTIYALLKLAKETFTLPSEDTVRVEKRPRRNEANPPLFPDYSKNLLFVYTSFVKWCIKESGSLDILCLHWTLPEDDTRPDKFYPELVELPSWVTIVRKSVFGFQQQGFGGRITGDSFVSSPENRCYSASLNTPPDIQWGRDQGVFPTKSPNTGLPRTAASQRLALPSGKTVPRMLRPQQGVRDVLTIKAGDLVCILYGCSVPCILRQILHGGGRDSKAGISDERGLEDSSYFYELIGEAFILGQMDGEAIVDLSEEDLRCASGDFHLV